MTSTPTEGKTAKPSPFRDPDWWRALFRESFGRTFWIFFAVAAATGIACYFVLGPAAFAEAVADDVETLVETVPRIVAAMAVAGLLWVMLPRDRVTTLIGTESGWRGLVVASIAGIITPGGPSSAFAILALLAKAGGDRGALVAYVTAWAMLGVQRVLVWDIPFMGADFSFLRFVVCVPLPLVAGVIARRVPLAFQLQETVSVARRSE